MRIGRPLTDRIFGDRRLLPPMLEGVEKLPRPVLPVKGGKGKGNGLGGGMGGGLDKPRKLIGGGSGTAGISYVGGAASLKPSTETTIPLTGLSGGLASSPAENDVAILMSCWCANVVPTPPPGWSVVFSGKTTDPTAGIPFAFLVAYKVLAAGEVTAAATPSRTEIFTVQVFRGVNIATPMDVAPIASLVNDRARPDFGAITPVTAGAVVVGCGASHGGFSANAFTSSDLTNFLTYVNTAGSFDEVVGAGFIPWSGTGPVDPAQFGGGATSNPSWCSSGQATITLRPA